MHEDQLILQALEARAMDAHAIQTRVTVLSNGAHRLSPDELFEALKRLAKDRLVIGALVETAPRVHIIHYSLTDQGRLMAS